MFLIYDNFVVNSRSLFAAILIRMATERWTFLTNHAHVLLCIATDPEIRLRDVALKVGITERACQRIVADLVEAGYLESMKVGRRNEYRVIGTLPLRHPLEQQNQVAKLLQLVGTRGRKPRPGAEHRKKLLA